MAFTIAVTGKGGVGKTTVSALLVRCLIERGCTPVLAVDADPNTCLDLALGVEINSTIGGAREEAKQIVSQGASAGIPKHLLLEMKVAESLVESDDFDLMAMGRPEGPGCYCYANNVLAEAIRRLSDSYAYVVIDNEAGLENLSRRIVRKVDLMVIVSDPSKQGMQTARRLHTLMQEMNVQYSQLAMVINRLRDSQRPAGPDALPGQADARFVLALPEDTELADLAERGASLMELSNGNVLIGGIAGLLEQAGIVSPARNTVVGEPGG